MCVIQQRACMRAVIEDKASEITVTKYVVAEEQGIILASENYED